MDEIRSDMMESSMREVMKMVVQESYEFSTFAVAMNELTVDILEGILLSETRNIADSEMEQQALALVMEETVEQAVVKYTQELASLGMEEEHTLNEDSAMLTSMIIDLQIKSIAEEEFSNKKQHSDIVKAIKDRLSTFKQKDLSALMYDAGTNETD
jgi:hypothetical protein